MKRAPSHKLLQKPPRHSLHPETSAVVKTQFSIFPPGKNQRPARFGEGVYFSSTPPIPLLRCLLSRSIIFDIEFELFVDIERIIGHDLVDSLLNFIRIFCVRELVRCVSHPHQQPRRVITLVGVEPIPVLKLFIRTVRVVNSG